MKFALRLVAFATTTVPAILILCGNVRNDRSLEDVLGSVVLPWSMIGALCILLSSSFTKSLQLNALKVALIILGMFVATVVVSATIFFVGCASSFHIR